MADELTEIKAKCEQYMGYHGESVGMAEVHAVLSFIHTRAIGAIAEVERLNGELDSQRRITGEALHQKNAKIERLNVDHAQTRAEGMEAAVKAVKETDLKDCYPGEDLTIGAWNDCREQIAISIVAAIRAAAKEQA